MYTLRAEMKAQKYKDDLIEDIQCLQCVLNMEESKYSELKVWDIRYLESLRDNLIKAQFYGGKQYVY